MGAQNIFFTADEHYGHANIIKFCNRPFSSILEMDEALIANHNSVVKKDDLVIHAGDFSLHSKREFVEKKYVSRLNGEHIFLEGSHDKWLKKSNAKQIYSLRMGSPQKLIVVCHYALHVWPKSHFNSWHLYGHSHGRLNLHGKSHDIGVDNNNFAPLSFEQIAEIMKLKPDNPNLIRSKIDH